MKLNFNFKIESLINERAIMVAATGTAALANCEFSEEPAIRTNHKGHEGARSSCDLADKPS
jgi:hypothetical protein